MAGFLWVDSEFGLLAFIILSALAAAVQFLHFALFQEDLLSLHYYLVTLALIMLAAWVGYARMRSQQMATQYSWAFERVGLIWRAR